jgi:signal transduction histidine kinase
MSASAPLIRHGEPASAEEQQHRRFVRVVTVASLGVVLLVTVTLGIVARRLATAGLVDIAERRNVELARVMTHGLEAEMRSAIAASGRTDVSADDRALVRLGEALATSPLAEMTAGFTIYDTTGRRIFSSTSHGHDGDDLDDAVRDARRGRVTSVLVPGEALMPGHKMALVVTHVPVRLGANGGLGAVIAVHEDVTPWLESSRQFQRILVLGVLFGLAGLYGVLIVAVRWADAVIGRTAEGRRRAVERRAELECEVRQRQRVQTVGTLAAGIAHDFNNVLWVIQSCSDLMLRDVPSDSSLREKVEEIAGAARTGADLVRQIVSFSRRDTQWREAIDVRAAVEEVLARATPTRPPGVEIHRCLEDCGTLAAAPGEIQQLAGNLVRNALQAVEDGGRVEVTLAPLDVAAAGEGSPALGPGRWVHLRVADTGHGMDAATIDRIFDPFFSTKDVGEGVGLGLAIVHAIVAGLEGRIRVQSKPDHGSVFDVYLPCRLPAASRDGHG